MKKSNNIAVKSNNLKNIMKLKFEQIKNYTPDTPILR